MRVVSLVAALGGSSLLLAAYALPSRVRAFSSLLGVERLQRSHRTLAILVLGLTLLHVLFVVARPGNGLSVLDLRDAPPRVWAGSAALLVLLLIVRWALTRRRRRPRYEGWRLAHVVLGNIVLIGTALHVWWLHDLIACRPAAMWFGGLLLAMLALLLHRWWWRPVRCRRNGYVVEEGRQVTPAAVAVSLRADGHRGLRFKPGQFAWMKVGNSPRLRARPDRRRGAVPSAGQWDGEIGRIRESILHSALGRRLNARLDYFVSGPDPMVDRVTTILVERWQVPAKRVHTELFHVV